MKIDFNCKEEYVEDEEILGFLILKSQLFINNGHWNKDWPKDKITVHANCNDVFSWGSADSEDVNFSDLREIYDMYLKDPILGVTAWCIKKRKCMPQKPVEDMFRKSGIWNLDELIKEIV